MCDYDLGIKNSPYQRSKVLMNVKSLICLEHSFKGLILF